MQDDFLYKVFASRVPLTEEEFEAFSSYFHYQTADRKEKLVYEGHYTDKFWVIKKGLSCLYKILDNGEIQVLQFAKEGYWIGDFYAGFNNAKALFTLETIEPCELWRIKKADMDTMVALFPKFETYLRLLIQSAYAYSLRRLSDVYSTD